MNITDEERKIISARIDRHLARTHEKEREAAKQYKFTKGKKFRIVGTVEVLLETGTETNNFYERRTISVNDVYGPDKFIKILDGITLNEGGIYEVLVEIDGRRAIIDLSELPWNLEEA